MNNYIYFIGAGPGDKELITYKGLKIIENADVIIYAGSLVNKEVLEFNKKRDVQIYNSAYMTLDETHEIIKNSVKDKKIVARVHTGDPSIYGAIVEQMTLLDEEGITYEVIPGVSSAFAAAAAVKSEFTLPEISQTVIFTRMEGKTPVPENEKLENIAKIGATLIIFLSVKLVEKVQKALLKGNYNVNTPVVIAKRVSWPDEEIIFSTVGEMVEHVKKANFTKTTLIMVGEVFNKKNRNIKKLIKSKLYDKNFKTEYRDSKN
jgi:precorrin-4/cobalt-precorrin-4 C11-methyltransferase